MTSDPAIKPIIGHALPEEKQALRIARLMCKIGPNRVLLDKDGTAVEPSGYTRLQEKARGARVHVYIRDDGWTLMAIGEKHSKIAEEMWRSDWIGRLEYLSPILEQGRIMSCSTLYVYSQQGFEYKVGELDIDGCVKPVDVPIIENEHTPPNLIVRTLDEMREWFRRGMDDE